MPHHLSLKQSVEMDRTEPAKLGSTSRTRQTERMVKGEWNVCMLLMLQRSAAKILVSA